MHGIGIGCGMHRDRAYAHFTTGTDHAQRDFPAIGNQDLFEHLARLIR
jgi:hypothetical protein